MILLKINSLNVINVKQYPVLMQLSHQGYVAIELPATKKCGKRGQSAVGSPKTCWERTGRYLERERIPMSAIPLAQSALGA
jgi:hypothetical protein